MIGLPLRLLAREVYNRAVERVGADAVALVTGEEKIKPPNPRFWVATVEAMPRDLDVAFLAVDEIQLAADFERGHVFTDRMLHRRGREETLVLGAATMRPIVERLLPGASIVSRPRLSQLTFAGEKKLTRLPRRTAIVAFSADEVYAIAELIRRQRGGAAVVLGALSPRTRNAQVALYQSGDVDYLVATDAIGMGLNLDVDHVAFASDRKFDGYQFRKLNPAEFAQIAGRAGRATRDGTFGTTGRCPPFETELVQALEIAHLRAGEDRAVAQHRSRLLLDRRACRRRWRRRRPSRRMTRAPVAEDILVLDHAARDDDVRAMTRPRADVERLWDVCQVPDYRKIAPADACGTGGDALWLSASARARSRPTGSPSRWRWPIAPTATSIRSPPHRPYPDLDFRGQSAGLARRSRALAGRHARGRGQAFRRAARAADRALRRSPHQRADAAAARECACSSRRSARPAKSWSKATPSAGSTASSLSPDASSGGSEAKALQNAAQKALAGEIATRATRLAAAPDEQFVLAADGTVRWTGAAGRQARRRRGSLAAARARHRRRASFRRAARGRGGAARRLGEIAHRETARPVVRAFGGRRHHRHRPRRRVPAGRGARRARPPARRRRSQGLGAAGAGQLAQIRRPLRRLSHLSAAAAQAGAARARGPAVGAGA